MEYILENERFILKVLSCGAEMASLVEKLDGRELVWQADPAVWPRHAPLLFPHCGKLFSDTLHALGKEYPAFQHGFARDMEFACVPCKAGELVLALCSGKQTKKYFPYAFALRVRYTLEGGRLRQDVQVENPKEAKGILPFSLGFHPGFSMPLDAGGRTEDYEFVFDKEESPMEVETPGGYVNGKTKQLFKNCTSIPLRDEMFADGSICLSGLRSKSITLRRKKGGGRQIRVDISEFPYLLLWGEPKGPLPFVCIEPWHSLPDGPQRYDDFSEKPGLFFLKPGQSYETSLITEFSSVPTTAITRRSD